MSPPHTPYRWLAKYYDVVFTVYAPCAEAARRTILSPIFPSIRTACDLACGTGTTALMLARRGIEMYGVDLSPGMCRAARQRAREADLRVRVSRQDMRSFRLPQRVDLVLCEYDALNHVPRKRDLARVLKAVAGALKPGGHFFFDVNNRRGFASYWKGSWCVQKPGIVLVMNNGNDAAHDRAWSDCLWFIRNGRGWSRHTERVREVCWSQQELRRALRWAGFGAIRTWDSTPFLKKNPVITPGCRTHYLARKRVGESGRAPKHAASWFSHFTNRGKPK